MVDTVAETVFTTDMETSYRIAPAPKFAGMKAWDCSRCGRQEVKPVFLAPEGSVEALPFGTGCAAKMLGRPDAPAATIRLEADQADRRAAAEADLAEERRTRYAEALEAFEAGDDGSEALASTRTTYHRLGGFPALAVKFPAF